MVTGTWPAFWMLGTDIGTVGWPNCGEIDIMEHVNTTNTILGTMHWNGGSGHVQYGSSTTTTPGAFHNPFYIILNLAIGGTLSGSTVDNSSLPTSMLVDYVHVYNITNAAPPVGQTITLKGSNGLYVTSNNADSPMTCDRQTAQAWEQFRWISNPDGTISLKGNNGDYVTSNNGQGFMTCDRPQAQGWEEFKVNQ